jgi:hypothetical protein
LRLFSITLREKKTKREDREYTLQTLVHDSYINTVEKDKMAKNRLQSHLIYDETVSYFFFKEIIFAPGPLQVFIKMKKVSAIF